MTTFVRSSLVVALPFILSWAFLSVLAREIARAFRYAWLEVRVEYSSFVRLYRNPPR